MKSPRTHSQTAALRQQAEDIFREGEADLPEIQKKLNSEASLPILHELRVHQIQLEMQNEELLRIQAELETSKARLFDLYELAPVGYVTIDEADLIQQINLSATNLLGLSRKAPIHRPITSVILRDDQDIFHLARKKLRETGKMQTCELRMAQAAGTPIWIHVTLANAQDASGTPELRLVLSDITERKRAEEALDVEHNQLRTLVDLLPTPVFVKDRESRFLLANAACASAMEVDFPELLIGKTDADFFRAETAKKFRKDELEVFKGQRVLDREQRCTLKNGEPQVLLVSKVPLQSGTGEITGLVGVGFDITRRVQMEDELRANEAFQMDVLNSLPAQIAVLDRAGTILAVNEPWLRFGRENGSTDDKKIGVGVHYLNICRAGSSDGDVYAQTAADGVEAVLSGLLPRYNMEYPCDSPERSRWFMMEVIPLAEEDGGAIVAHSDISERKQAQRLLAWEKSALELIISTKSPDQALDRLMLGLESQMPGALCSVLILDADGVHLRLGAAPSLPPDYNLAIDGMAIGTAALEDQQVLVLDIGSDPSWSDVCELAHKHDLHSCWSTLIRSQGKILGTFSIYYHQPHSLDSSDMVIIERTVNVIRIAIERKQAADKILQLNTDLEERVRMRTLELQAANASLMDFKAALDEHAVVAITNVNGDITYANDKFCKISKYAREELLGKNHRIVNSGYHSKEFFREMWKTILSGRVWTGEVRNRAKDDSFYWMQGTIVPFLGADGKPEQFIAIRTDITERKNMEEALQTSHQRLRLAAEAASIAVWEWDLRTNQLKWDARMFEIYGLTPSPDGRVRNTDWTAALTAEDVAEQQARLQHTVKTCGRDQREFQIIRASDKAIRVIQASEMVIKGVDGKADRVVGINFDATETKQVEQQIRKLNAALEIRAAALEAANKELDSFTYSVSHDLRAPLRAVDGFSQMVIKDCADQLDDEGRRKLNVIRNEAHRMERLIDDLLAFSRLGREPIISMPIDMETMARQVFDELSAQNPERKLRLNLQKLPSALGSGALIRQVWVNLISNAIKFTRDREIGEIDISAKDNDQGGIIYSIKDNGVGFDMRHAHKLFGVFQRLHSQDQFTGTGVGLALVQRIIVRHGGLVWAEAKVNHGATFYFTLANQPE